MDQVDARVVALEVIEARKKSENPYDCLLLPRGASFLGVRAAYKRLLFLHPDKNPTLDVAHEAFKIVRAAFDEIKSQATVPDPSGAINNAAPVANKWSAYTSAATGDEATNVDFSRGGIPSAPAQPPPPPPQPQHQPTAWNSLPAQHSKWGRSSTDAQRLLKVPETSTSRLTTAAPTSLPQSVDSEEEPHHDHPPTKSKLENDLTKDPFLGKQHAHNEHDDVVEIDCGSFYKQKQQQKNNSIPFSSRAAPPPPAPAPPAAAAQQTGWNEGGGPSKWKDASGRSSLVDLLRNPEAATAMATKQTTKDDQTNPKKRQPASKAKNKAQMHEKKRRVRTRAVIDTDSDEEFKPQEDREGEAEIVNISSSSDSGLDGRDSSGSDDGWEEDSEKEEAGTLPEASAEEAKSKALIQLLLAQQRSQANNRLRAGAAGAAQQARQRAAFGRRGGSKRKQTRLKLAPITSK